MTQGFASLAPIHTFKKENSMKLKQITAGVLASIVLLGCAHKSAPSSYRFDYQTTQSAAGVIRAFDDGQHTIVQFIDLEKSQPVFSDGEGNSLEYEVRGQYAVLPQIFSHVSVNTTAGVATFKYTGQLATMPPASTSDIEPEPVLSEDLVQVREQIKQAKQELADIQKEIANTQARDDSVLYVLFPADSIAFQPDEKTAKTLLNRAREAGRIMVTGHADNSGSRAGNEKLALARAEAAKAYLIRHGIDAAKIMTVSKGEREPVASNDTPKGRTSNRRVEIAFANEPGA